AAMHELLALSRGAQLVCLVEGFHKTDVLVTHQKHRCSTGIKIQLCGILLLEQSKDFLFRNLECLSQNRDMRRRKGSHPSLHIRNKLRGDGRMKTTAECAL